MTQFDEVLAKAKPVRRPIPISLDGVASTELEELLRRRAALPDSGTLGKDPAKAELDAKIAEVEQRVDASEQIFVMQSIGSLAWGDLLAKHPPTADDMKLGMDHNPRTFAAAAIAACCVDPQMTEAQVGELMKVVSFGQGELLFMGARAVNLGIGAIPKSERRSAEANGSATKPPTAAPEVSLEASSSAAS